MIYRTVLLAILMSAFSINGHASVCDKAYTTSNAHKLWLECEILVLKDGTPRDQYLLAKHKQHEIVYKYPEQSGKLVKGIEDEQYRMVATKNFQEIIDLLTKSAESGYIEAQYELAMKYSDTAYGDNPIFSKKHLTKYYDLEKAFQWYKNAAERGHPDAQRELAEFYLDGKAVESSIEKGVYWLTKSARQENPLAASKLSYIYLGVGTENADILSYAWRLYFIKLHKMSDMYFDPMLDDELYEGARKVKERPSPLTDQQKEYSTIFLDDLANGRFDDAGIPDTWKRLVEASKNLPAANEQ